MVIGSKSILVLTKLNEVKVFLVEKPFSLCYSKKAPSASSDMISTTSHMHGVCYV